MVFEWEGGFLKRFSLMLVKANVLNVDACLFGMVM